MDEYNDGNGKTPIYIFIFFGSIIVWKRMQYNILPTKLEDEIVLIPKTPEDTNTSNMEIIKTNT